MTPESVERRVKELPYLQVVWEGPPRTAIEARDGLPAVLAALPIAVVALHLDRAREDLEAAREAAAGSPRERLFDPAKGMPRREIAEVRSVLRALWGDPYHEDAAVELYRRPAGP